MGQLFERLWADLFDHIFPRIGEILSRQACIPMLNSSICMRVQWLILAGLGIAFVVRAAYAALTRGE